jgi:hypothetical protein
MNEENDRPADDQEHAPAKRDQPETGPEEDLDKDPAYNPDDEGLKGIKGG